MGLLEGLKRASGVVVLTGQMDTLTEDDHWCQGHGEVPSASGLHEAPKNVVEVVRP